MGGRIRRCWWIARFYVLGGLFCLVYLPAGTILTLLTLGLLKDSLGRALVRGWGLGMLYCSGIELRVEQPDVLKVRANRIFAINHTSTVDAFIMSYCLAPGGAGLIKKEFLYVPLLGVAAWLTGFIFIDRSNRERAAETLAHAGRRMADEKLSVIFAPEGTRSKTGELGPFKLGMFHLVRDSGADVVPMLIHGAGVLYPRSRRYPEPGRVTIRFLDPIPASRFDMDALPEEAEKLRSFYLRELTRMADELGSPRKVARAESDDV